MRGTHPVPGAVCAPTRPDTFTQTELRPTESLLQARGGPYIIDIYEVVGLVKRTLIPQRFGSAVKGARRAFISILDGDSEPRH